MDKRDENPDNNKNIGPIEEEKQQCKRMKKREKSNIAKNRKNKPK